MVSKKSRTVVRENKHRRVQTVSTCKKAHENS